VANRVIQQGITLDYELKKVYQFIPRRNTYRKPSARTYYKEKVPKTLGTLVFRAS
jgi:hypothetical protein